MKSIYEFAALLTTAVRKIKALEGKNLDVIQDELGFMLHREGASYINYLRRGNIPGNVSDLEALTRVLRDRQGLAEPDIERFLRLGGHPNPQVVEFSSQMPSPHPPHVTHTPSNDGAGDHSQLYPDGAFVTGPPITKPHQFFGRERELRRIFAWCRKVPMSHIALVGPKRSGKTSLLQYLTRIHTADGLRDGQKQDWLPNHKSYRWVWIDFRDSRARKLESLLRHMLAELDLPAPNATVPCDLDTFMDIAAEPQHWQWPTIIVMDNIDVGLRAPDLGQAVWDSLRALTSITTEGNLAFIVSAHDDPARLADEHAMTSHFWLSRLKRESGHKSEK